MEILRSGAINSYFRKNSQAVVHKLGGENHFYQNVEFKSIILGCVFKTLLN